MKVTSFVQPLIEVPNLYTFSCITNVRQGLSILRVPAAPAVHHAWQSRGGFCMWSLEREKTPLKNEAQWKKNEALLRMSPKYPISRQAPASKFFSLVFILAAGINWVTAIMPNCMVECHNIHDFGDVMYWRNVYWMLRMVLFGYFCLYELLYSKGRYLHPDSMSIHENLKI